MVEIEVSPNELKKELEAFCKIGTRWSGTPGEEEARRYIFEKFKSYGLDTYMEEFQYLNYSPKTSLLEISKPAPIRIKCEPLAYSANTPKKGVKGELIYAGTSEKLDDLGAKVKGKIVLAEAMRSYLACPLAEKYGAEGFILGTTTPGRLIRLGLATLKGVQSSIPSVSISYEDDQLLQSLIREGKERVQARIIVNGVLSEKSAYNVVARIYGKVHPEERVLMIAHYDCQWNTVGALDYATSLIGMLKIAERLSKAELDRTIEFVASGVEELGLFGSKAYIEKHKHTLENIVGVIDGALLPCKGGEFEIQASPQLMGIVHDTVEELKLDVPRWHILPSFPHFGVHDHVHFVERGVPAIWLLGALYPYYHTSMDRPENVDYDMFRKGIELAEAIIQKLAKTGKLHQP